jgi:hypothetical protein
LRVRPAFWAALIMTLRSAERSMAGSQVAGRHPRRRMNRIVKRWQKMHAAGKAMKLRRSVRNGWSGVGLPVGGQPVKSAIA